MTGLIQSTCRDRSPYLHVETGSETCYSLRTEDSIVKSWVAVSVGSEDIGVSHMTT